MQASWMATRQNIRCLDCGAEFASDGGAWAHSVTSTHGRISYQQPDGTWSEA